MRKGQPIAVLLDEGTPIQAAQPFHDRGHHVILHGDVLSPGAKDEHVCAMALLNEAALVAVDRDMRHLAKRFGSPEKGGRFDKLNLIFVNCKPALAVQRIEHFMSLIELEWQIAREKKARALWLDIGPHYFRSFR